MSAVAQLLHRARGAAVNLALPELTEALKHVAQIPVEKLQGDAWRKQRAELEVVVEHLIDAVNALPQLREIAMPQLLVGAEESSQAMTHLTRALGRGELDEKSLRILRQAFREAPQQIILDRIQQAMMDFEFSTALHHLEALQQTSGAATSTR